MYHIHNLPHIATFWCTREPLDGFGVNLPKALPSTYKEIAKNNASAQNINTVLKLKSMHEMKGKRIPPSFTYFKNSH
jgi:hypothetical protein